MPRTDLSATQVARILDVNYQTLNRWIVVGILTCDVPAEGIGSRRRFTTRDAACGLLGCHLHRSVGLHLEPVRTLLDLVRAHWRDDNSEHAGLLACSLTPAVTAIRVTSPEQLQAPYYAAPEEGKGWAVWLEIDIRHAARHVQAFNKRAG